ncbi:MAG: HAMP domain-containing sensor histidine kinase [Clostridium sp.]
MCQKMSIDGLFKDKFLNRNILLGLLAIIGVLAASIFYINDKLEEYQSKEIIRYANIIGAIEANIGGEKEVVSYIIDDELNQSYVESGLEHLGKYGYFENMGVDNKWIGTSFIGVRYSMIFMSIMFVIAVIIIGWLIIYNLLYKVNKVSEGLRELSYGKEFIKLEDKEEGAIALLYHRYNMTAVRMNKWIAELELERNLIKELLNDLSHQLKTPIASIKMNTELILDGYTDEVEAKQFLENNTENIERMQWITEGLIQLSRLEAHCIKLNKKDSDLKKTLLSAINSTYGKAISKGIHINVESMEESIISHDERWTTEAIINVIDNAIKYSKENDDINIALKSNEWKSEVIIEDFGYGIKKEDIENVFKRFYRSFDSMVQAEEGSGIGLYLSKKIIEDQDGSIKVQSKLGCGSKFTITLYKHIID